jgi:hypothetical protein
LEEVTNRKVRTTLKSLFVDAKIATSHGIVILGNNSTTGFGKSALAITLAAHLCKSRYTALGLATDSARVFVVSTVDILRSCKVTCNDCVVFDEFEPGDGAQIVHLSANGLKILLDSRNSGSLRGRNDDKSLPSCVRIFTGNADGPKEWLGGRFEWSQPMQRKAYVWQLEDPLIEQPAPTAASSENNVQMSPRTSRMSQVMSEFAVNLH